MKTSDFDYHLPPERIAQTPLEPRHNSRLMIVNRQNLEFSHVHFYDIANYLKPGDLIVINKTKVIPARIMAKKPTGGKVEVLLLRQVEENIWECLVGGKRILPGMKLQIENGPSVSILQILEGSKRLIRFDESVEPFLQNIGKMPLPPYIHVPLSDPNRYQTVYAQDTGSAAAPTAGLHFTRQIMDQLMAAGIRFCEITLHVGLDTFAPVDEEDPQQHHIHSEWCELTEQNAQLINQTHQDGGRIVAVGTTSVRTLESAAQFAQPENIVAAFTGATRLFILPGFKFKAVDSLLTNFHLPRSTLLMLVSAFAGSQLILDAYHQAIEQEYRFYSFGDAMLII